MYYSVMTNQTMSNPTNEATATFYVLQALELTHDSVAGRAVKIICALSVSLACAGCLHGSIFASGRFFFAGSRF